MLVTATLDAEDVGWPDQLPAGWTETSDTQATFTVEFDAVECMPVSPVAPTVTQATCTAGVVTVPTIVLGTTTGIIYEVAPPGPYDGTKDVTVTVTATLADGYEWGQIPERWQKLGPARATFTVVLTGTSCEDVTPVEPTVTQAACTGGVVTRPTLALAETDGITYTADPEGPYTQGQSVLVTATLDAEGVGWPDQLPEGWTETSDTQATFTVEFDAVECTPVAPVAPTVTQATCVNGAVSAPAIVLPTTPGVIYSVDPDGAYDGTKDATVTVTATLVDGLRVGPAATRLESGRSGAGGIRRQVDGHVVPRGDPRRTGIDPSGVYRWCAVGTDVDARRDRWDHVHRGSRRSLRAR